MTHDSNPYELPPDPGPLPGYDPEMTPSDDERNLAFLAHLSGCAGVFAGGLIGFAGPLVIYLLSKDSPYVAAQAKEALNFQITLLLLGAVCVGVWIASCGVLFPILFLPALLQLIFGLIAAFSVREGTDYRYPMNLRLLR